MVVQVGHGAVVLIVAACAAACMAAEGAGADAGAGGKLRVYVGGRGKGRGGAIWRCELDLAAGTLGEPEIAAELDNPSFQELHPSGRYLYSVMEGGRFEGKPGGGVAAFAIDSAGGALTPLNRGPSGGRAPCHLSLSPDGKCLLGANYSGGNVFAYKLAADGRLGERTALVQHKGKSVHPRRQKGPHAHSINPSPDGRFAFACDLGLDKVLIYRLDANAASLVPHGHLSTAPGAGPRHFAFHPSGKFAYVINELDSTMIACTYDAAKGTLTAVQTLSTLPADYEGRSYCAEVQVHPNGKFVYGSNRGHESIVVFAIDGTSGKITPVEYEPTRGKHPRNFRVDPTGRYLLAANRNSDNVVVFRIDPSDGTLTPTGCEITVPSPACVRVMRP